MIRASIQGSNINYGDLLAKVNRVDAAIKIGQPPSNINCRVYISFHVIMHRSTS